MELLATVEIPQYVRLITLAEKQRPKYYKEGEVLPEKYKKELGNKYSFKVIDGKSLLTDINGELVIKNPRSAGQPKGYVITGNDLHSLRMPEHIRSKIIKAIKADYIPRVAKLEPITKFPIRILCEIHDTPIDWMYIDSKTQQPKEISWDIDNRALFYMKVFPDVLQGSPMKVNAKDLNGKLIKGPTGKAIKIMEATSKIIIPNDDRRYITQPPVPLFVPIDDTNNRKLVFKIYHDDRKEIQENSFYQSGSKVL